MAAPRTTEVYSGPVHGRPWTGPGGGQAVQVASLSGTWPGVAWWSPNSANEPDSLGWTGNWSFPGGTFDVGEPLVEIEPGQRADQRDALFRMVVPGLYLWTLTTTISGGSPDQIQNVETGEWEDAPWPTLNRAYFQLRYRHSNATPPSPYQLMWSAPAGGVATHSHSQLVALSDEEAMHVAFYGADSDRMMGVEWAHMTFTLIVAGPVPVEYIYPS